MRFFYMLSKGVAFNIFVVSLCIAAQETSPVFTYGPADYVKSGQAFRWDVSAFVTGNIYNRPFCEKLSLTRLPGALYSGPTLFGGWQTSGQLEPVSAACSVYNDGEADPLFFRFKNGGQDKAAAAVLLCGVPNRRPVFSDIKEFRVSAKRNGLASGSQVRPVIKVAGRFYVGAPAVNIPKEYPVRPLTIKANEWMEYDPYGSIGQIGAVLKPGPQPGDPVDLVGFHFQHVMPGNSALERSLFIRELEVRAVVESERTQNE